MDWPEPMYAGCGETASVTGVTWELFEPQPVRQRTSIRKQTRERNLPVIMVRFFPGKMNLAGWTPGKF